MARGDAPKRREASGDTHTKMTKDHFKTLETAINAELAKHPNVRENYASRGLSDIRLNLDLLHAAIRDRLLDADFMRALYAYLNDDHIGALMAKYAVNWDNGNGACGTFPERFDAEAEAEEFATDWARERNLEELGLDDAAVEERGGEGCYTAEVIEVDEPGIDPEAAPDNPRPQWA